MGAKSFSNRLNWRILLVVLVISLVTQFVVALIIANEYSHFWDFWRESYQLPLYLNIIGLVGLVIIFFVNRSIINNMTRYREELKASQEANILMESDLTLARNIQTGMLPNAFPPNMYAILNPAKEVGGDLYDFIIKDDQLYFAIGDVSGKGLPASLVMAIMSATLHLVEEMGLPMNETLQRINDSFSKTNKSGMFVTLFVARLDLKTGRMNYCNGGHCPLLIIPPDAEPYLLKSKPNLAVGMFESFDYEAEQRDFKPGTRIIAYTDGVTEAERKDLSQFGKERLMAWAKHLVETSSNAPELTEKDTVESLFHSVCDFVEHNPQNDDITIMSIKLPEYDQETLQPNH